VEERAGSPGPTARRHAVHDSAKRLARLQATLTDLLGSIDDDARLMDASLADAHRLVEEIRGCVTYEMLGPDGPLHPSACQRKYNEFMRARFAENDMHEVYSGDLERYQKRQMKDLGVAELDSDGLALVKRRRVYISKVLDFQAQASAILAIYTNAVSMSGQ
jgi:hypothetical protein